MRNKMFTTGETVGLAEWIMDDTLNALIAISFGDSKMWKFALRSDLYYVPHVKWGEFWKKFSESPSGKISLRF